MCYCLVMNLYQINVKHFSEKDSHTAIETFLLAKDDESVYYWINGLQGCCWEDHNTEDNMINIHNEDFEIIGQKSFKDKIIHLKGDLYDKNLQICDRYYGVTIYGWEQINAPDIETLATSLRTIGVLTEI